MNVEIISPDNAIFSGTASLVQLPGVDGLFEILDNHAPMIAVLKKGIIKIVTEKETLYFEVNGGVVETMKNVVQIMVE